MSRIVNFLLLLSALLSALTGVGGSVRAQDRAQAVAGGTIAARRVAPTPLTASVRPANARASLLDLAQRGLDAALVLTPREPAFANRRRE